MIAAHDLHRQLAETHAKVAELGIALNDARAEVGRLNMFIVIGDQARCEDVTNAAVDEQRRIAAARVSRERETAARIAESRGDPRMGRYIAGEIRKAAHNAV